MLKKLQIKNFRTHELLNMEFSPYVNVIWGLPGSGKTNILRAIDWITTNKPKFERVHSHFAKDGSTSVELILDNGVVKLEKTSKSNEFTLDNKQSFSFTGSSVPEPIAQLLNLNEINISKQLDQHFLICSTPGDVGKTINRITKIEKIDNWISKLITLANKTKWKIESLESECDTLDKQLLFYKGIESIEKEITLFEKLSKQYEDLQNKISYIFNTSERLKVLQDRIDKLQELDMDTHMKELSGLVATHEKNLDDYMILQFKKDTYRKTLLKKQKLESLISEIHMDGLDELIKEMKDKTKLCYHLQSFTVLNQTLFTKQEKLKVLKEEYISGIKKLGICPICQNSISIKHIKELEASL